jgi:MFS family permease
MFGGFLLLGDRAGDLLGRKETFVAGVVAFSAASLANGLAQSPGMLIIGRGVQGLGGAFLAPPFSQSSPRTSRTGRSGLIPDAPLGFRSVLLILGVAESVAGRCVIAGLPGVSTVIWVGGLRPGGQAVAGGGLLH